MSTNLNANRTRRGAPIFLSSSVTLNTAAPGISQLPDMRNLTADNIDGYFVEEIHFSCSYDTAGFKQNPGPFVRVKMRTTSNHNFSEDPVPLWSLMPIYSPLSEISQYSTGMLPSGTGGTFNYRWVLPSPLYIAPGDSLEPTFHLSSLADPGNGNLNVSISYQGRTVDQASPSTLDVPWVICFDAASATTPRLIAVEKGFRNILDKPIKISRAILKSLPNSNDPGLGIFLPGFPAATLTIRDSNGYLIAQDFKPGMIFDQARMAWSFDAILGAKQKYEAMFTPTSPTSMNNTSTSLSFIGYRTEKLER